MMMDYATECKIDAEFGFKSRSTYASCGLKIFAHCQHNNILFKLVVVHHSDEKTKFHASVALEVNVFR